MLVCDQHLYKSLALKFIWSLPITITLFEIYLFLLSGVEKFVAWPGMESLTVDLSSLSGAFDLSAIVVLPTVLSIFFLSAPLTRNL